MTTYEELLPMLKAHYKWLGKEGRLFDRKILQLNAEHLKEGRKIITRADHSAACSYPKEDCSCGAKISYKVAS